MDKTATHHGARAIVDMPSTLFVQGSINTGLELGSTIELGLMDCDLTVSAKA